MIGVKSIIVIFVFYSIIPAVALGTIINIPEDYTTIQQGIDASTDGDTVLVAPGVYIGNIVITNKNVLLTSAEGPEDTQIKGLIDILEEGVDTTCVIRGFTITPDPDDPFHDVRPTIDIEYGSPVIEQNIIIEGGGQFAGAGGLGILYSNAIIRNNIVRNNRAYCGAGIAAGGRIPVIEKNIIADNIAYDVHGATGGGMYLASGIIRYNLIINNEALAPFQSVGGGIHASSPVYTKRHIYNNTIVGNSARTGGGGSDGGGIALNIYHEPEDVLYKNNIIAFNPYGGGVYASSPYFDSTNWDYNLVFGNEDYDYEGIIPGEHDIQEDPLFVDRFSGDYHLLPNSPCIDAGDPDFPLDPDSTRADIGAYYFDQAVGIDDPEEPTGPYNFRLRQNYPNPFNARTIISYNLNEASSVSLMIFSIRGQLISSIVDTEIQPSGEYQYFWDGVDMSGKTVSTGIYFYELYVDGYRESKAMILIR
jgi:hypothetical protein